MLGVSTVEGSRITQALSLAQQRLATDTRVLSSGLRITGAADDPSGLAISSSLAVRAQGLDTGAQSISSASNALTVADGALQTVTDILQRLRQLVVAAGNDLESSSQLHDIQTEVDELKLEINRIAQNTSFNGLLLLNGTFDTSAAQAASIVEITPAYDLSAVQTGETLASGVQLATHAVAGGGAGSPVDAYVQVSVAGFTAATGGGGGGGGGRGGGGGGGTPATIDLEQVAYSNDPAFGPNQDITTTVADATSTQQLDFPATAPANTELTYTQNAASAADIGVTDAFEITGAIAAGGGTSANVGVGDAEGDTVQFSAPNVSTSALDIANISVLPGTLINAGDVTQPVATNEYAVEDSLYRIDNALTTVGSARATIGSQLVALGETQADSANDAANLVASSSTIRDANIGATATDFTKAQILVSVGTSVLSQNNASQQLLIGLLTKGTAPSSSTPAAASAVSALA